MEVAVLVKESEAPSSALGTRQSDASGESLLARVFLKVPVKEPEKVLAKVQLRAVGWVEGLLHRHALWNVLERLLLNVL